MTKTVNLRIPLGYRLVEKVERVKLWQAESYLLSRRASRYTKAVRHGDEASLHACWLVCPHCGKELAATARSLHFGRIRTEVVPDSPRISRERVREWATMQLSLFEDRQACELPLSPPSDVPRVFFCPECGRESQASTSYRQVRLGLDRKRITVDSQITGIDELLNLGWGQTKELKICFPVRECLTFDLGRGRVYVQIRDSSGSILCQRDITGAPEALKGGASHKLLTNNKLVLRNLKRLFQQAWGRPLPYSEKQLDIPALFKMTVFVGYDKGFYACIPFEEDSFSVHRSFRRRAKQLHRAKDFVQVFESSLIPKAKSIRRLLFLNPGLFFYADEICCIWTILEDINLLSRVLVADNAFEILSGLHARPGMFDYLRDLCRVKDAVAVTRELIQNWGDAQERALDYCAMSQCMRSQMQAQWRRSRGRQEKAVRRPGYSLPMHYPDERIQDCVIDGYSFCWLRSSNEYSAAARQLGNCLDEWKPHNSPVVCVKREGQCVAAIEIFKGQVVQARGYDNVSLEQDPPLHEAFQKWMACYGLKWVRSVDDFARMLVDDDAELPF